MKKMTSVKTLLNCQQWELFDSFLETIHVIIHLNNRFCFPIVDFRQKKFPLKEMLHKTGFIDAARLKYSSF